MIDGEADGDTFGKLCSTPIGRRLRHLRLGQFDRQICRCRLLCHRILAFADCRPYIFSARTFFQAKNAHEKKNSWLRAFIRRFPRIRPRPLARKHSRRRPRHFHLAQQSADFLFSRHRLLLLFGTPKYLTNFKFDIGHHRRSLDRQPGVRS